MLIYSCNPSSEEIESRGHEIESSLGWSKQINKQTEQTNSKKQNKNNQRLHMYLKGRIFAEHARCLIVDKSHHENSNKTTLYGRPSTSTVNIIYD